jgi:hypothetical protein
MRLEIAAPRRGRKPHLRCTVPSPAERPPDRQLQLTGQVIGLVEATADGTDGVQRNGHHRIRAFKHVVARMAEDDAERLGEQPPTFIFECVDELAQWAVVPPRATRN